MLELYFEAPFTLNRLRSGPSEPFIDSFASSLKASGYSWWAARGFLRAAAHFGSFAGTLGDGFDNLNGDSLEEFRRHLPACSCPDSSRGATDDVARRAWFFVAHLREPVARPAPIPTGQSEHLRSFSRAGQ
jgi:hypothetical protein